MSKYWESIKITGRFIKFNVKWACIGHCFCEYVGNVVISSGPSMEPTLTDDNVIYVDKVITYFRGIRRGDIVISRSVTNPKINICKRVAAVGGEYIYLGETFYQVPDGHVWLVGDNFRNSTDSRTYGAVPRALIIGRVICALWPSFQLF